MRAWIRLSLGALSWCQLDLQLLVVLCAHAHWACLDVGDAHGGGDRARREARQRFSRLGAPGHAAAVVGAPRRVLDDPDALGGLLGGLHFFGGDRGHLIVVVPVLVPRLRPRLRVTSKFPGSIHLQVFVRPLTGAASPKYASGVRGDLCAGLIVICLGR